MRFYLHSIKSARTAGSFLRRRALPAVIVCFAGIALPACSARQTGIPENARNEIIQAEIVLSRYAELRRPALQSYLQEITARLQAASGITPEVKLLKAGEPFAFSASSGIIVISSALASTLANEAELFFVLAHETAHIALGHSAIKHKSGDQQLELEADRAALRMLMRSGYYPAAALGALLKAYGKGNVDPAEKDYPAPEERLLALQKIIAERPVAFAITDRRDFQVFKAELRRAVM